LSVKTIYFWTFCENFSL